MSIRKVQLGKEDTAGTAVAATTIYRAPANDIKDARVKIQPDENIGYYQKLGRSYDAAYNATHSMAEHEATFEQIGYILNAGIEGVAGGRALPAGKCLRASSNSCGGSDRQGQQRGGGGSGVG